LIARNSCSQNGAVAASAGIHVTSQGNRIEENHLVFNSDAGIRVAASNNFVIRNSSRFNNAGTANNYVIAAGNFVGAIVTSDAALESAANNTFNISY
jgi:parallel beta-helix repeat protein